ncbi:hypothetical protein [Chitinophaga sancti]|uniref:Uncharacterized protein n=1 Tax=Chitinophaga sancti TaxID=1004 RepID=A0A1K1SZH7_9BACT|nr:hypothetical protein [Chitinophaga sancti]WQD63630.1 hypothetical protein U0033_04425 [Chitinophaga sancti]WQG90745.1 hypothetical protein SR876_04495 [Chitinophaga sancti]SFW89686.1 hypothetical protein SAMN05661012_06477 [Chitinophaga sancti]
MKYVMIVVSFLLTQSGNYKCLENGLQDIISQQINCTSIDYKIKKIGNDYLYILAQDDIKIYLSKKPDFDFIQVKNSKVHIPRSGNFRKVLFDLEGVSWFRYDGNKYYILSMNPLVGKSGLMENIVMKVGNGVCVVFNGVNYNDDLTTSIGIHNNELFLLNQRSDSIQYFGLREGYFQYDLQRSVKCKYDTAAKVCIPVGYTW